MKTTKEVARNFAVNIHSRMKGAEKLMDSAGIDWCTIHLSKDGSIHIGVDSEMSNTDVIMHTFRNIGNSLDEGSTSILDAYGQEVA